MKNIASIAGSITGLGPLAFLSLQHTPPGTEPDVFTNEQRVRAYRDAQPSRRTDPRRWTFHDAGAYALQD